MSKLASRLGAIALLIALSLAPGCGTIYQAHQTKGPAAFGGIRLDIQEFGHEEATIGDKIFFGLDIIFSLGGDACMLLFSGINELYEVCVDGRIQVEAQRPSTLDLPLYLR